jgi:hypothetical protein
MIDANIVHDVSPRLDKTITSSKLDIISGLSVLAFLQAAINYCLKDDWYIMETLCIYNKRKDRYDIEFKLDDSGGLVAFEVPEVFEKISQYSIDLLSEYPDYKDKKFKRFAKWVHKNLPRKYIREII